MTASPVLRDLPFDVALWATLSFMRRTNNRWGGIMLRLVTVDDLVRAAQIVLKDEMRRQTAKGEEYFFTQKDNDCSPPS